MSEYVVPAAVSYSVRVCRACRASVVPDRTAAGRRWHCPACHRSTN